MLQAICSKAAAGYNSDGFLLPAGGIEDEVDAEETAALDFVSRDAPDNDFVFLKKQYLT